MAVLVAAHCRCLQFPGLVGFRTLVIFIYFRSHWMSSAVLRHSLFGLDGFSCERYTMVATVFDLVVPRCYTSSPASVDRFVYTSHRFIFGSSNSSFLVSGAGKVNLVVACQMLLPGGHQFEANPMFVLLRPVVMLLFLFWLVLFLDFVLALKFV